MKVLNIIFYSFCILLLASILWFKPKGYIVQSGSMEPSIKVGSIVVTTKLKDYKEGDVITFKDGDKTITHRIMYENNGKYMTSGDANEDFDLGTVSKNQIIGKVNFSIPYIGYLAQNSKDPKWFIFLVIVPATIIIYEEIKFLLAQVKRKKVEVTIPKASVLVPVMGAGLILFSASFAYFFDKETSESNILGAAASYGEKTAQLFDSSEFTCDNGATNFSSPQSKVSIFEKENGNLKVTVKLEGATPSSTYDLWVNQDPGGCPLGAPTKPAGIVTDSSGNGIGDVVVPEVIGATKFWVSAVGGGQVLRSTAVTF